jgi:hypothetical protein
VEPLGTEFTCRRMALAQFMIRPRQAMRRATRSLSAALVAAFTASFVLPTE